ncbi:MAG: hypothetical protein ABI895_37760, partial [Deltaproteobacteria bacterium]
MGGSASVESEPGLGARFLVRLPRQPALQASVTPALAASDAHRWSSVQTAPSDTLPPGEEMADDDQLPCLLLAEDHAEMR